MHFCHSERLWQEFPQLVPATLALEHVGPVADLESRVSPWLERARERVARAAEADMPEIAAWRRAFSQMGLKPTKYRCAAEALLRRFKREGDIPRIHPVIDICNAISLAFALPVAAFDLDQVDQFLEVRHAKGGETYLAWSGETEEIPEDEIVFVDASDRAHARRWTFRQSRTSTLGPETSRVLVVAEGLHETAPEDIRELLSALEREFGLEGRGVVLSARSPRAGFA